MSDTTRTRPSEGMRPEFPRRICLDRLTPAETAIVAAMHAVEEAGCDVRLTDAITFLAKARTAVADFVDGVPLPHEDRERHIRRRIDAHDAANEPADPVLPDEEATPPSDDVLDVLRDLLAAHGCADGDAACEKCYRAAAALDQHGRTL